MNKPPRSKLQALMDRLRKAIAKPGMKAKLARDIGVSRSRVYEWHSGMRAPSGELTLRLLEWVTEAERNPKNTPGSGTNTAKGKTRKGKSIVHEKSKSSPPPG